MRARRLMARDPPLATGQPNAWQASIRAQPTDELIGLFSGLKACAATPPKRARASGVLQERARIDAGAAAGMPKRARRSGCLGRWTIGAKMSSSRSSKWADEEPNTRRQARPSSPSPRAVSSIDRTITPALPSSSGCARSISAKSHSRPCFARSRELRKGEPAAIGWVAEQSSCRSPGTVSSLVRVPPPIVSAASRTVTPTPFRASSTAQASPLGPEPTTIASLKRPGEALRRPKRHRGRRRPGGRSARRATAGG